MLLLNKIKLRQAGRALGLGEAHKERALEASPCVTLVSLLPVPWRPNPTLDRWYWEDTDFSEPIAAASVSGQLRPM